MNVARAPLPEAPSTEFVDHRSLGTDWLTEADRFKWIESQKAGRDLGESALQQWVRDHWWGYLRARWLEHLQGKCFWIELDRGSFGLLRNAFTDQKDLLDQIVGHLKNGHENLDILLWADHNRVASDVVIRILESLDVNASRLIHKFDPT